jgi:hypothetical protein
MEVMGLHTNVKSENRLIMRHVGGIRDFLLVHNSFTRLGLQRDYHGHMNARSFEKWAAEKLIPNLPPQ